MTRPLTRDAQRLVVLIGALSVPTLPRLHVGTRLSLATLADVLKDLRAAGLVTVAGNAYPLTAAGREQLAELLQQERRPTITAPTACHTALRVVA